MSSSLRAGGGKGTPTSLHRQFPIWVRVKTRYPTCPDPWQVETRTQSCGWLIWTRFSKTPYGNVGICPASGCRVYPQPPGASSEALAQQVLGLFGDCRTFQQRLRQTTPEAPHSRTPRGWGGRGTGVSFKTHSLPWIKANKSNQTLCIYICLGGNWCPDSHPI